jgi:uncharacterized membrane protein
MATRFGWRHACSLAAVVLLASTACNDPMTGPSRTPALAKAGNGGPTVTSASPAGARQDTTLDVHVFGSGFDRGSTIAFVRAGVVDSKLHVNAMSFRNSGELVANVTVAADAETVPYDVAVTLSTGKKGIGTELFVVEVAFETLQAPGGSNVSGVSADGKIAGTITVSCGPGFAPALWDLGGQLTTLPALAGTCGGVARAINIAGVVVGSAYVGSSASVSVQWSPAGTAYGVGQLPPLPNGTDPGPWDINASGTVSAGNEAAVWTEATGWQLLVKPSGATFCVATHLNEVSAFTGRCTIGGLARAIYWAGASATPVVLPLPSGSSQSYSRDVNVTGVIVGWVILSDGTNRPVRWVPSGAGWTIAVLDDLGKGGAALSVNDAGQVAGSVSAPSGTGYPRPVYWDADGTLHLLESKDGVGEAVGISEPDAGLVIAGYVRTGKNGGSRIAVRWRP